jgi:RimJ/RimL family protein N-acetyltransferase
VIPRDAIRTERLVLEPVGPPHTDALWRATRASLEELRPWLGWARAASLETSREFAQRSVTSWESDVDYAFVLTEDGDLVGGVGIHTPRLEGLGELGYWTRSDRTGRGYMTEAADAAVDFGFGTLGLYRLELRAGVENPASQRVAEKLGFRREGTLRQGCPAGAAEGYDCHLYGLLASDRPGRAL